MVHSDYQFVNLLTNQQTNSININSNCPDVITFIANIAPFYRIKVNLYIDNELIESDNALEKVFEHLNGAIDYQSSVYDVLCALPAVTDANVEISNNSNN